MFIKRQTPGFTLIILLIVALIIALLVFSRSGFLMKLMGTKENPGTVNVQLDSLQKNVDDYNQQSTEVLEQ